ncbi:MAG: type IV pilus modification PilV family protein [Kangiellaceae bacterium]
MLKAKAITRNQNTKTISGFTLVELIITIVITSIAATMFASIYSSTQLQSVSPVIQVKAAKLGQAYLEEISLRKFDENSPQGNSLPCDQTGQSICSNTLAPESGESRSSYDDIDDYNGLVNSPPQDSLGNDLVGFSNFSVRVDVSYAGATHGFSNRLLKRIQVTVTTPQNESLVFSTYKGNF